MYDGVYQIKFWDSNDSKTATVKRTWDDWGLIPSQRYSHERYGVWSNATTIPGSNGSQDLKRVYFSDPVNRGYLKKALHNDNIPENIRGYTYNQLGNGSFQFIVYDQDRSLVEIVKEVKDFLHNKRVIMGFRDTDAEGKEERRWVRTAVSFQTGTSYSSITINYATQSIIT